MLRKTFITLTAVAALGVASTAMAAIGGGGHGGGAMGGGGHGGGMMGGGGMGGGGMGGHGGGMMGGGGMGRGGSSGAAGISAMPRGGAGSSGGNIGPMTRAGSITTAPMASGRVQTWGGRTAWGFHDRFHDHFRNRFHHRFRHHNFVAFGVGVPIYDYAYDSCWAHVPTRYGWRWVYVCGDYGYY
jgi:hypothetical protein